MSRRDETLRWAVRLIGGLVLMTTAARADEKPRPRASGLKGVASVAVREGRTYVSLPEAGQIVALDGENPAPLVTGLDAPGPLVAFREWLFVLDRQGLKQLDRKGNIKLFAGVAAFPTPPKELKGLTVDVESGTLYASDASGRLYRISPKGRVDRATDAMRWPGLKSPAGLTLDSQVHLLVADSGALHRLRLTDGKAEKVVDGIGSGDALVFDRHGRLYIADRASERVLVIARPGEKPVVHTSGISASGLCLDATGQSVLAVDDRAGTLTALRTGAPGFEVDETPIGLASEVAFPKLKWAGWQGADESGKVKELRPIVLTHAGDGSNRVFVATQHGVIHVFANNPNATKSEVFLDLQDRVRYDDNMNEEGFLGLAFHPRYKENGELYVFYTPKRKNQKHVNLLSRFRVRKDDPNRADPASEEVLLRVEHPFWNHDGGTVAFGPDGYLYLALGDGGAANDPFDNGQNLQSILGKVLRLDVNRKEGDRPYAIPADNPFAGRTDARPEIWSYGLRNVWRLAFDRQTGACWAADVGQNLWEEINLLTRGGNYGWNRREGLHPFGPKGVGPTKDLIDPIWEYHHDTGKSITGGLVYRGERLPELAGHYVYADYVSGAIWALRYDEAKKRVVANRPIRSRNLPVLSFGEDERGEVYYLIATRTGEGVYRFVRSK